MDSEDFTVLPRMATHPRPEAVTNLAMVNVLSAGVTWANPYGDQGGHLASDGNRPRLEVVAWVHDVAYDKDVWADVYLFASADQAIGAEMLRLDYQGVAGGDGGLFALNALVPSTASGEPRSDCRLINFRLYYRVNDAVFTDGILHAHRNSLASQ